MRAAVGWGGWGGLRVAPATATDRGGATRRHTPVLGLTPPTRPVWEAWAWRASMAGFY
jgi:hypothetical protein